MAHKAAISRIPASVFILWRLSPIERLKLKMDQSRQDLVLGGAMLALFAFGAEGIFAVEFE